ncbi:unnamed protein product [Musa acuminata subsp. malaccensis]|uniref:(wild Malaysian banana) hypothetical protein n=1 Tax=Musa acuminata subsp. malaccensis TaxID=214687 RepID=A0A8D6ZJY7_MUSAM|nr:unnamed protein product [Musa acuminata subsp. malaccensis]
MHVTGSTTAIGGGGGGGGRRRGRGYFDEYDEQK